MTGIKLTRRSVTEGAITSEESCGEARTENIKYAELWSGFMAIRSDGREMLQSCKSVRTS